MLKKLIIIILMGLTFGSAIRLPEVKELSGGEIATAGHVEEKEVLAVVDPKVIIIPKIGVYAPVEDVGKAENGNMADPDWQETGWYKYGSKPGENGQAVIAGHYDSPQGPATFHRLTEMDQGDSITVQDSNGNTYYFVVYARESYLDSEFPVQEIFGNKDGVFLNLITCHGEYNRQSRQYDRRLVIRAELIGFIPAKIIET